MAIPSRPRGCCCARWPPGNYPRSGKVHLRLWLAEQIADMAGAVSLASAPCVPYYARALGAKIGRDVDLHSIPPVTGMLSVGTGAAIEPEVDLSGWWIDGDRVHIGPVLIGAGASVGARSTLMPGAKIGAHATIAPGSAVSGKVKAGLHFSGSPASRKGKARQEWPDAPPKSSPLWSLFYPLASAFLALIPYAAAAAAVAVVVLLVLRNQPVGGIPAAARERAAGGRRLVCRADAARGPDRTAAGRWAEARLPPRAQPDRLAGLGHRTRPGHGPRPALPHLRQPFHPRVAAPARREGRQERRGLHRPAHSRK